MGTYVDRDNKVMKGFSILIGILMTAMITIQVVKVL